MTCAATRFEAGALALFALAAWAAGIVLVGQVVARHRASTTPDLALLGLGLAPAHRWAVVAAGPALAAWGGCLLGAAGAAVASGWFPIGTASAHEPSPGRDVDWLVLAAATSAAWLAVVAGAAWAPWRGRRAPRPSPVAGAAAKVGRAAWRSTAAW